MICTDDRVLLCFAVRTRHFITYIICIYLIFYWKAQLPLFYARMIGSPCVVQHELYSWSTLLDSDVAYFLGHEMGSFCIYKQQKRISILCYACVMESAILHNIRCLSFSVVYKCRRIPSYEPKHMRRHCQARLTGSIDILLPTFVFNYLKKRPSFLYDMHGW